MLNTRIWLLVPLAARTICPEGVVLTVTPIGAPDILKGFTRHLPLWALSTTIRLLPLSAT